MAQVVLQQVRKAFGEIEIIKGVDLQINDNEFVVFVGPSGCGKSTLLRICAGLLPPSAGSVAADGAPITGPGPERGVVFQQNALFPWLTVAENIRFGLDEQGMTRREADRRTTEWIAAVGLDGFATRRPGALSGGMAQRVALARALAPEPGALLLDEPFGALDRITRAQMQDVLVDVWRRTRATLLLVTHDVEEALVVCDRVLVMSPRPGRVVADMAVDLPRPRADRTATHFVALRRRIEELLAVAIAAA